MVKTTDAIQARLTQQMSQDLHQVLAPLVRREHYALEVRLLVEPAAIQSQAENVSAEDLLKWLRSAEVRVTVDRNIKKPALDVIKKTIEARIDPLQRRKEDRIEVVYADLSSLKGFVRKAVKPAPPTPVVQVPSAVAPVVIETAKERSTADWIPIFAWILGCSLIAFAIAWPFLRLGRKLEKLFTPFHQLWDRQLRFWENQSPHTRVAVPSSTPAPSLAPSLTLVSTPFAIQPAPSAPAPAVESVPKGRVRPVSTYTLERQLNAKRKILFQNSWALVRVLLHRFPAGAPHEEELAHFLKSLAPKESESLSRFLTADELIRFSQLSAMPLEKAGVNRLIRLVDDLSPEVASLAGLNVPFARAVELIEKFEPNDMIEVVRRCSTEVAAAILRSIPPDRREPVFSHFEGESREALLKQFSDHKNIDPTAILDSIVQTSVRVCLNRGLQELLLLWLSEARLLLSRAQYQALMASIREEASGLITKKT